MQRFISGTENDFKFWSSKFLSHFKERGEKCSEGGCHCSSESQSANKACRQTELDSEKTEIQDDEVGLCYKL